MFYHIIYFLFLFYATYLDTLWVLMVQSHLVILCTWLVVPPHIISFNKKLIFQIKKINRIIWNPLFIFLNKLLFLIGTLSLTWPWVSECFCFFKEEDEVVKLWFVRVLCCIFVCVEMISWGLSTIMSTLLLIFYSITVHHILLLRA